MNICLRGGLSFVLSIVLSQLYVADSFPYFAKLIPNGERVPHPCKPNYIWHGVGHWYSQGGGARNPFGVDFSQNNKKWDKVLCEKDSDGDGKTNGAELGDAQCMWREGSEPSVKTGITHPGICDPTDSVVCSNVSDSNKQICDYEDFTCPYSLSEPEMQNITFSVDESDVPAQETTYCCQFFDLPHDKDYHVIATVPKVDNRNVMHHIILYGCKDNSEKPNYQTPGDCNGMKESCLELVSLWSLGDPGHCHPENTGFRIGPSRLKYALLEVHWNNPEKKTGYRDRSGLQITVTSKLRPYDLGVLTTGQLSLTIPPGKINHTVEATVRKECTENLLNGTIYIRSANIHMHYLGASGSIQHYRAGKKVGQDLAKDDVFQYDAPVDHKLTPPVEFKPGDELKTVCTFNSKSRTKPTHYGDATSDEMCFGYLTYFPASPDFFYAVDFKDIDVCTSYLPQYGAVGDKPGLIGNGCYASRYTDQEQPVLIEGVKNACQNTTTCSETCKQARTAYMANSCSKGDQAELLIQHLNGVNFTADPVWLESTTKCTPSSSEAPPKTTAATLIVFVGLLIVGGRK